MSQISLKSISGITSITTPAGVDNQFTLHTNNTSQALKLDSAGNIHIHNHVNTTGVSTASNFKTGTSNLHNTGLNVQDLDVDGHTNLDNVSISGVTTVSGILDATNTPASIRVAQDIQHKGDANTKITFPANDTISFDTGGNERLRITSAGKVGINTNNPQELLEIQDRSVGTLIGLSVGTQYGNASFGGYNNYPAIMNNIGVPLLYCDTNNDRTILSGDTVGFGTTCSIRIGNAGIATVSAQGLNVTGVVTATSFSGSGANLTNLPGSTPPNNFLINGAMQVNVRGTNHQTLGSFNPVTSSIYTLDRWKVLNSNSFDTDSAKVVQDNGAPTSEGFRKSIMMNIGNTETPSSTQVCGFQQKIEAQNLQSLAYGTSSAKTMTLTFWVYSNKTGTYCVQIMQDDVNKYVLYEYTISSSNTWEKKTITVAGNTSDAINNDTGIGLEVNWILCVGSGRQASATSSWTSGGYYVATSNQVNLWDHADNYFKMTGCQLQVGAATDFIHEDISTTLRKCQRYFYMACGPDGGGYETIGTGMIYYSGTGYANVYFPTTMRTQPSIVALSGSSGAYMYQTLLSNTAAYTHQIAIDTGKTSLNAATVSCACPSSRAGEAFRLSAHFSHDANGGQSFVNFDAEL